jgi:protein-S-isoprenylcysteine O-methyltransferase Ste14
MSMEKMQERRGEHPWGDAGQLIALGIFLVVWVGDSFFLHASTFLSDGVPLLIRLAGFGLALGAALGLVRSGHVAVSEVQRPVRVITGSVFRYVRHPLYLAALLGYLGLIAITLSLLSLALWGGIFVFYNYTQRYSFCGVPFSSATTLGVMGSPSAGLASRRRHSQLRPIRTRQAV